MSSPIINFGPIGQVLHLLGRNPEAVRAPAQQPGPPAQAAGAPAGEGRRGGGPPADAEGAPAGRGGPPGAGAQSDVFNRPTDVAWDAAGNIYVADGFGNARVAKYDKNGKFIKSWGSRGLGP